MSRIEEADKVRRSIERGEPQPTYMSQSQKDAWQVLIDLNLKAGVVCDPTYGLGTRIDDETNTTTSAA